MTAYLVPLHKLFLANANPDDAAFMKGYMKNHFEFFGIKHPPRRKLCKQFLKENGLPPAPAVDDLVKELFGQPEREFHYFAIELLQAAIHPKKGFDRSHDENVDLFEWLVTHKSWWDSVDYIADVLVGAYFQRFPNLVHPNAEKWMASGNMWLQRTTLIFQRKYRRETDFELMKSLILRVAGSKEFFLQKAIGWALREYARTAPKAVVEFVENNELAPLSRREALKHFSK